MRPKMFFNCAQCILITILALLGTACDTYKKPIQSLEVASKGLHSSAISPDGKWIVIGSVLHGASLWDTEKQARIYNWNHKGGEATTVTHTTFSFDNTLAITANPFELTLWETQTGEGIRFWRAPGEILSASLDKTGHYALLGLSDHTAVLFDIQRGGVKRVLTHNNRVRSVSLSHDSRWALTGSEDFKARLWDTKTGQATQTFNHNADVQLVQLSHDASMALSASQYDQALIWDTQTGETIGKIPLNAQRLKRGLQFTSAAFNADNTLLLTGRPDQIIQLWDLQEFALKAQWKVPKRKAWSPTGASITSVSFKDNNTFIAVASNGFVHTLSLMQP